MNLLVHPGVGGLYRGPNSETIIKGPDGSVITAEAAGGSIHTQGTLEPIVAAEIDVGNGIPDGVALSVVPTAAAAVPAVVGPAVATVTALPIIHNIEIVQPDPHIIETEIVDAPVVEPQQSTDLVGPSGSISTRGSSSVISGPASTTISEPARIILASPVVAAIPVVSSVSTPLLVAPVEVIPNSVATASNALQPTISTVTVGPPINSANTSPQVTLSTFSTQTDLKQIAAYNPYPISTVAPPTNLGSERISSSTIVPPIAWKSEQNYQISTEPTLSGPAPATSLYQQEELNSHLLSANVENIRRTQQRLGSIGEISKSIASIEPASSYGVLNNAVNTAEISSTIRPDLSISSTLFPPVPRHEILPPQSSQVILNIATVNGQIARHELSTSINQDLISNRQLNINPLLIPSANIIPQEIGPLPAKAIDLGTEVTVSSVPRVSGLYSPTETPNIQRPNGVDSAIVDNNIRNTDGRIVQSVGSLGQLDENQHIAIQNLVANFGRNVEINGISTQPDPTGINLSLLRNTNPISSEIAQTGLIGAQLSEYGIDSSQINLSNVPLSSVTPLSSNGPFPLSLSQNIKDSSSVLWNRYGREAREKKN
ncbi:hypothetical protein NQ314_016882 [Rhamnusium bicolor]|uniref:Uncharacterized protein n=1 Tax=Rhamnusium bicolor TaxID=1586634 RepID=A0AAV8WUR6_9CUCU|nr:hypothetical protein NQ314_016882 [Rhamnusium bicolor]